MSGDLTESKFIKYKTVFRQSKNVLLKWEKEFIAKEGRKPNSQDFINANQKVQVCFRNVRKISAYFKQSSQERLDHSENSIPFQVSPPSTPADVEVPSSTSSTPTSFSGLFPKSTTPKDSRPCNDISNTEGSKVQSGKRKAWGDHVLNKSLSTPPSGTSSLFEMAEKMSSKVSKKSDTRISLKRSRTRPKRSKSFLDTLSSMDDSQISTPEPLKLKQTSNDATDDPEATTNSPDTPSVFSENSLPEPEVTSQDLSFSGLFSQNKLSKSVSTPKRLDSFFPIGISGDTVKRKEINPAWLDRCSESSAMSKPPLMNNDSKNSPTQETSFRNECQSEEVSTSKKKVIHDLEEELRSPKQPELDHESDDEDSPKIPKAKRRKKRSDKPKKLDSKNNESFVPLGPGNIDVYSLGFEEREDTLSEMNQAPITKPVLAKNSKSAQGNYVKINLKKKVYVRGKKHMTGAKYRRMEFKKKTALKDGKGTKTYKCFKCSQEGHWANECPGITDKLMPLPDEEDGELPGEFPTLEEAASMAEPHLKSKSQDTQKVDDAQHSLPTDIPGEEDDLFDEEDDKFLYQVTSNSSEKKQEQDDKNRILKQVKPYFSAKESKQDRDDLLQETLNEMGFEKFRHGQKEAILNILSGNSTLVLLATGSGKSLVYQLPAYLYAKRQHCITIVVSPLVSLMEDQVTGLPPKVRAACLHSYQTESQQKRISEQLKSGAIHFLLVSPETLSSAGGVFASLLPDLPPIAFVCIDEAHCISQWSHNFRPAYLRLCKVVREKLKVNTILGLTATAPESTIRDIATSLSVNLDSGVIRGELMPNNLLLSVSRDQDRDQALMGLLLSEDFINCNSIIIYCTRRDECVRLSDMIRTNLQDRPEFQTFKESSGKRKLSSNLIAEAYHAGLTSYRRKTVQKNFMSGKLKVVVATVAFGMGIDKSDIRAIIHYNMPKSFESYIQEIGRAGRDGNDAFCHLFLNCDGKDSQELKRHIFSNSVDESTIRKLLSLVFNTSNEADAFKIGKYKEMAISMAETVEELDLHEENISTLLCYLENSEQKWIKLLNPAYGSCRIRCYGGPKQLNQLAHKSPVMAAALAIMKKRGAQVQGVGQVDFPVVEVAAAMGWDSGMVKRELKNLQWNLVDGRYKRSGVLVEFSNLSFHLEALKGLQDEEKDQMKDMLIQRVKKQEKKELYNLQRVFRSFSAVAMPTFADRSKDNPKLKQFNAKLKSFIEEYFQETSDANTDYLEVSSKHHRTLENESQIISDIKQFVLQNPDHKWTGRAVARIFQGIGSPNYPAQQWARVKKFWRCHLDLDFNLLCKLAKEAILSLRTGR